jgi:hypothetical protein
MRVYLRHLEVLLTDQREGKMRCIVCGGDHQPSPSVCDSEGMDREAAKIGAKRWNALTAHVAWSNRKASDNAERS